MKIGLEADQSSSVLDEVQQPLVGPLQILEHHHDRQMGGQPLEEQPPAREQLLAPEARLGYAEQRAQPRGGELAVGEIVDPSSSAMRASRMPPPRTPPRRCPIRWRTISASAQ